PPSHRLEKWRWVQEGDRFSPVLGDTYTPSSPPVSVTPAPNGASWVTLIGDLRPEQSEKAQVEILKWDESNPPQAVLSNLLRSSGAVSEDLDGDGKLDLLFHGFGYHLGHLSLFWGPVTSSSTEENIDEGPGPMFTRFVDLDGDGKM